MQDNTKSPNIDWRAIVAICTVDLWSHVTMHSLFPIHKRARLKCTWKAKVSDLQNTTVSVQNVVELLEEKKKKKVKSKCGRQVIIFRKESLHTSYSHSFEKHHLYSIDTTWNAFNKAWANLMVWSLWLLPCPRSFLCHPWVCGWSVPQVRYSSHLGGLQCIDWNW